MKSWPKPTPEQVERARAHLGRVGAHRYFFDRLNNPEWIEPLHKAGFFRKPPSPQRNEAEGTISFPFWPDSRFLSRMAPEMPEMVASIAEAINTENVWVNEDLLQTALNLPPKLAVPIARKAQGWAQSTPLFLLPTRIAQLVVHLAEGGQIEGAFNLAYSHLTNREDSSGPKKQKRPRNPNDVWRYEEILKIIMPALTIADGPAALALACDLLAETFKRPPASQARGEDYSQIWRPSIQPHEQNRTGTVENLLVDVILDVAGALLRDDKMTIEELVAFFEKREWFVFRRIAIELLAENTPVGHELAEQRLLDRELFDHPSFRHEYSRLLEQCFGELKKPERQEIIDWIMAGPDLKRATEHYQRVHGNPPTKEHLERHKNAWTRDRLLWFGKSIPADLTKSLEKLISELGESEHPTFLSYHRLGWGLASPKTAQELQGMAIPQVLEYLRTWEPSGGPLSPNRGGLSREFQSAVRERPQDFVSAADDAKSIPRIYVSAYISGLGEAAAKNSTFPWEGLLDFCIWVVEQPRGEELEGSPWDEQTSWAATRLSIARLLHSGLQTDQSRIPISLRTKTWKCLAILMNDPDPSAEDEAKLDSNSIALNSVRGETFRAVIQYALWLRQHFEQNQPERVREGFKYMPEVYAVLEEHLDLAKDPSPAIRSVYGHYFPWLSLLNSGWAKNAADKIFPTSAKNYKYWGAAWTDYLFSNHGYDTVFDILREKYTYAIHQLKKDSGNRRNGAVEHLGEHLLGFLWRGKLTNSREDPLWLFMENTAPAERARTIELVGRILLNMGEELPEEVAKRLTTFWEMRLEQVKRDSGSIERKIELRGFSLWLGSGKFSEDWGFRQLQELLTLQVGIDFNEKFLKYLLEHAGERSQIVIDTLTFLFTIAEFDTWRYFSTDETVKRIVGTVLGGTNTQAKESARALVNTLGARGNLELRALLKTAR